MKIIKNSKGQIITLDLLLALIPITLAIGYSALAIDEMGYRMGLFASEFSLDRRASDAADILIKTPGVPPDWDRAGNLQVIGLARYNLTTNETYDHYLDVLKIAKINKTTMSTIGLTNFRFVLKDLNETVTWSRNSTNPAPPNNASNVVLVHRLVVSARAEQMAGIRNITSQTPVGLTKVNFNFTVTSEEKANFNFYAIIIAHPSAHISASYLNTYNNIFTTAQPTELGEGEWIWRADSPPRWTLDNSQRAPLNDYIVVGLNTGQLTVPQPEQENFDFYIIAVSKDWTGSVFYNLTYIKYYKFYLMVW